MNGDPIANGISDPGTQAYIEAINRKGERDLNIVTGVLGVGGAIIRGVSTLGEIAAGSSAAVSNAASAVGTVATNGAVEVAVDAGSVKLVNPTGSTQNCTNCVVVVDNLLTTGNPASALPRATPVPFNQLGQIYGTKFTGWTTPENIESTLLAGGNGTRAVIYGTDDATGHVWNAVVQNGKVNYIDGQIGGSGTGNFQTFTHFQFGILP